MPNSFPVKWFSHDMQGAPVVDKNPGKLVAALDACLITGFGDTVATSVSRIGNFATVSFGTAHAFKEGQIVEVGGCVEAEWNDQFRITQLFTNAIGFEVPETHAATATTGTTFNVRIPPIGGWEIVYSQNSDRVYRSTNPNSTKPMLRVRDTALAEYASGHNIGARISVHTNLLNIDTDATGAPRMPQRSDGLVNDPTAGWAHWYYGMNNRPGVYDSSYPVSNTAAKQWTLVGDDRTFYWMCASGPESGYYGSLCAVKWHGGFGEYLSFRQADPFNQFLIASHLKYITTETGGNVDATANRGGIHYDSANNGFRSNPAAYEARLLMRDHTGYGDHTRYGFSSLHTYEAADIYSGYSTGIPWPNPYTYGMIVHPVYMVDVQNSIRGIQTGLYFIHNNIGNNLGESAVVSGVAGYPSRKFLSVSCVGAYGFTPNGGMNDTQNKALYDITGPWVYE